MQPSDSIKILVQKYQAEERLMNEAETRLLLINEVLSSILGWSPEAFNPESHLSSDSSHFLDYHLSAPNGIRVVIEAKKTGTTFYFAPKKRYRIYSLSSLRSNHGEELSEVIRQAVQYCQVSGTNQFIVTNGRQWIASINGWPNVEPSKVQAVVFRDLEDIASNLVEFIDLFSPSGISTQRIRDYALQSEVFVPSFAEKINSAYSNYPAKAKNYLVRPIEAIMQACFDEMSGEDRRTLLSHCYVSNDASEGYFSRLEFFVGQTFPTFIKDCEGGLDRAKFDKQVGSDPFSKSARAPGEAVILIGKIGSGKTTFIEYALKKLREKYKGTSWMILHLNMVNKTQLRSRAFDHDRLIDEISTELLQQAERLYLDLNPYLYDVLRGTFSAEIQRERAAASPSEKANQDFESKLDAVVVEGRRNSFKHLLRYLSYLNGNRNISTTIVVDNIDRGTQEFEEVVFSVARRITAETGATTVTAMRDTTFEHGRRGGFLDVSQNLVFAIQPPAFLSVAARRFDYVQNRLSKDSKLFARIRNRLEGFPLERVMDFMSVLAEIVLKESADIRECIQSIAGTNVRLALEYLRYFATSANTDIERLLKDYNKKALLNLPSQQPIEVFIRSIMRMDLTRYSESSSSPVVNLFQGNTNQVVSHFTLVRVLQMLRHVALTSRDAKDCTLSDLMAGVSASPGHSPQLVKNGAEYLGKHGLVLSRDEPEPPYEQDSLIRISAAGVYYLENLIGNREYLRSVADDTIVYDHNTFKTLSWIQTTDEMEWHRKENEKAKTLLRYLHVKETAELNRAGPRNQRPNWLEPVILGIATKAFGSEFSLSLSRGE